jgi:hypothetical protein
MVLSSEARAEGSLLDAEVFFSPGEEIGGSILEDFFIPFQEGVYEEETHRRTVVGESPPPRPRGQGRRRYDPNMPAQWSLRLGYLFVSSAEDEVPTDVPSLGLSVRILLPPDGLYMFELSFDSSVDRMELDPTPTVMEDFYQEYYDLSIWFLGSFGARTGVESPLYWGVGLGYSKETARANYLDSARALGWPGGDAAFNESGVFQLKIGWDSGRNTYIELVYKKVMDSDRNLDQMFNLVLGIYF